MVNNMVMIKSLSTTVFFIFILQVSSLHAKVELPSILSDNMVLQQNSYVKLWGRSTPGGKVKIKTSWNNEEKKAMVNKDGYWEILVETTSAGGPYNIQFNDGEELVLSEIYLGEVWFCSGQSNMEMPVKGFLSQPVENSLQTILESEDYPQIRFFTVKKTPALEPQSNVSGKWDIASIRNTGNFSAVAYFFALELHKRLKVPVGIIHASWGGATIDTWMSKESLSYIEEIDLDKINIKSKNPQTEPTLLYNGMLMPVSKYTIRGALWYQGENHKNMPGLYRKLFPVMVKSWRNLFGQNEFPFYYVQIAPYKYQGSERLESAYLREVQLKSLGMIPNSGMVVTMDIGDEHNIHPPQKGEIGFRLALLALSKTYGYEVPCEGPVLIAKEAKDNKIILTFEHADTGLIFRHDKPTGFEICDESHVFTPAQVKHIASNKLEVWSDSVESPIHVRYCFRNYVEGTLMNAYGLPASPFRTDDY